MNRFTTVSVMAGALLGASSASFAVNVPPFQEGTFNALGYNFLPPGPLSNVVELREDPVFNSVMRLRGFFSFQLPTLGTGQSFQSATLSLHITGYVSQGPLHLGNLNFTTISNPTENFTVFPVATTAPSLVLPYGPPSGFGSPNPAGVTIYNDLGGASGYGSFNVGASDVGSQVLIPLNAAALADLNAAAGQSLSFGLHFTGTQFPGFGGNFGAPLVHQGLAFSTTLSQHDLALVIVPAPGVTMLAGFAGIAAVRRRGGK